MIRRQKLDKISFMFTIPTICSIHEYTVLQDYFTSCILQLKIDDKTNNIYSKNNT